jgi:DNA-binding PadR family transcriptional regulator
MSTQKVAILDVPQVQAAVLRLLLDEAAMPGHVLRDSLGRLGEKRSAPSFYQLMGRLEDAGFVEGWYQPKVVDNHQTKERWYRLTPVGRNTVKTIRAFYASGVDYETIRAGCDVVRT